MNANELTKLIKSDKKSVQNAAEYFHISRTTFYKYIDHYENSRYEKIPEEVLNYFFTLTNESPETKNERAIIKSVRDSKDAYEAIKKCRYAISMAKQDIDDLKTCPELFRSERTEDNAKLRDERIKELEDFIKEMNVEIERQKNIAINKGISTSKLLTEEDLDERIERLLEKGMYGGPGWQGSYASTANALCIADGSDYMVITDDLEVGPGKSELFLYAVIAGKKVHIATYQFPENESFIKFSLIPKLSYFYEVVSYAFGEEYRTGILELTSSV